MRIWRSASRKDRTTSRAMAESDAFIIVAFSRSRKPMRPMLLDRVIWASGHSARTIAAAFSSMAELMGAKTEVMATARSPASRIRRAAARTLPASKGEMTRPSNS